MTARARRAKADKFDPSHEGAIKQAVKLKTSLRRRREYLDRKARGLTKNQK